ncbi:PadR family transcriptional regulator [Nucisporomicrobium flavum]|uniref:PadR family transcriptional regulator n=1 Tax=Nucisporomicrobium flavum TaxID=2785915 RepID=UPI003C2D091E
MNGITRITTPLIDVLAYFLTAFDSGKTEVYGWAIMRDLKRSGPTVYGVLDRLEDAGVITSHWEDNPEEGRPRRRLYVLTPNGHVEARQLIAERRPEPAQGTRKPGFALFSGLFSSCTNGAAWSGR